MSLVLLDTNHTSPIEGDQTDWLAKTLKEREDMPTVFVFNHVPAYPSVRAFTGNDAEAGTGADNRKYWLPLFERYNVDAVFEHHDHAYKRTHPLLDGRPDPKGMLYLGDGSWGKIRRPDPPAKRPYLAVTDEAYHLSVHRDRRDASGFTWPCRTPAASSTSARRPSTRTSRAVEIPSRTDILPVQNVPGRSLSRCYALFSASSATCQATSIGAAGRAAFRGFRRRPRPDHHAVGFGIARGHAKLKRVVGEFRLS